MDNAIRPMAVVGHHRADAPDAVASEGPIMAIAKLSDQASQFRMLLPKQQLLVSPVCLHRLENGIEPGDQVGVFLVQYMKVRIACHGWGYGDAIKAGKVGVVDACICLDNCPRGGQDGKLGFVAYFRVNRSDQRNSDLCPFHCDDFQYRLGGKAGGEQRESKEDGNRSSHLDLLPEGTTRQKVETLAGSSMDFCSQGTIEGQGSLLPEMMGLTAKSGQKAVE
jgi:hypothetical protein